MSGFDPIRIPLPPPWEENWIEIEEPEMGFWVELQRLLDGVTPETATIDDVNRVLALLHSVIVDHNLVRRDGTPFDFTFERTVRSQYVALMTAVLSIGDGTANPMPRATSPARSSGHRARRRSTSGSGSSRRR